jgi:tetratricopeptide (TPR) repeat protein
MLYKDQYSTVIGQAGDDSEMAQIKRALEDIVERVHAAYWFDEHKDEVYETIERGLGMNPIYFEALSALLITSLYVREDYAKWSELIIVALMQSEHLKHHDSIKRLTAILARFYSIIGHSAAEENTELSLALNHRPSNVDTELEVYLCLLEVFMHRFDQRFDARLLTRAQEIVKQIDHPQLLARAYTMLGTTHAFRGEREQAIGYAQSSLCYWWRVNSRHNIVRAALLLGKTYRTGEQYTLSKCFLMLAKRHCHRIATHKDYGEIYYELGVIAYNDGLSSNQQEDFENAERHYRNALKHFKQARLPYALAAAYNGLALVQIRLKKYAGAQAKLEQAEEIWKQQNHKLQLANIHYCKSFLEAYRGRPNLALQLAQESLEMLRELPTMPYITQTCALIELHIKRIHSGYYQP